MGVGRRWGQERGVAGWERLWSCVQDLALLEDQSCVILFRHLLRRVVLTSLPTSTILFRVRKARLQGE